MVCHTGITHNHSHTLTRAHSHALTHAHMHATSQQTHTHTHARTNTYKGHTPASTYAINTQRRVMTFAACMVLEWCAIMTVRFMRCFVHSSPSSPGCHGYFLVEYPSTFGRTKRT